MGYQRIEKIIKTKGWIGIPFPCILGTLSIDAIREIFTQICQPSTNGCIVQIKICLPENSNFLAHACNRARDHSTIKAFLSSTDEEIEDQFTMVLMIYHEERFSGGVYFRIMI